MKILSKIKEWWLMQDIEGIEEFKKYKLIVTLTNGEVIECYSNKYVSINCSYSKYISYDLNNGLMLGDKFYPMHMIKHIEDEVIDTQLVCVYSFTYGLGGLTLDEIKDNQSKYSKIIEKYKSYKRIKE